MRYGKFPVAFWMLELKKKRSVSFGIASFHFLASFCIRFKSVVMQRGSKIHILMVDYSRPHPDLLSISGAMYSTVPQNV